MSSISGSVGGRSGSTNTSTGAGASTAKQAPPIAGTTLDGKRVTLASLRGRPVLINVWSSW